MTFVQIGEAVLLFLAGWAGWWAAEYLIHRFVGHGRSNFLHFARHHKKHHALGDYFAPLSDKVKVSVGVGAVVLTVTGFAFGLDRGIGITIGFILSYLTYEWLHRRAHSHPPKSKYGRWVRRHHFYHHFMNPASNHGVTTAIGDLIFSTKCIPEKIKVPEKLKMAWLTNPQTGEVWPEYSEDYVLVRLKTRSVQSS